MEWVEASGGLNIRINYASVGPCAGGLYLLVCERLWSPFASWVPPVCERPWSPFASWGPPSTYSIAAEYSSQGDHPRRYAPARGDRSSKTARKSPKPIIFLPWPGQASKLSSLRSPRLFLRRLDATGPSSRVLEHTLYSASSENISRLHLPRDFSRSHLARDEAGSHS